VIVKLKLIIKIGLVATVYDQGQIAVLCAFAAVLLL
jgi:hypothetical protein